MEIPCQQTSAADCTNSDLLLTNTIAIVAFTTLVLGSAMEKIMTCFGVLELVDFSAAPDQHNERHEAAPSAALPVLSPPRMVPADDQGTRMEEPEWDGTVVGLGRRNSVRRNSTAVTPPGVARWQSRGALYQAFARFDANVLQPALGGPSQGKSNAPESVEL